MTGLANGDLRRTRFLGYLAAAAFILYGTIEVWTNIRPNDSVCAAWLCPEEFYDAQVSELIQANTPRETQRSIELFKRALRFDPASAYNWANLADVSAKAGDSQEANYCFRQALAAGPRNPAILLRAANFYFNAGDYSKTTQYLEKVLQDPELTSYYSACFLILTRMGLPIKDILNQGIPAKNPAAQAFLRFLMDSNDVQDSEAAWNWIKQRRLNDERLAGDYIGFLLRGQQGDLAAKTWASLNLKAVPGYHQTNWLYDGGFEVPPVPVALDWRMESNDDVEVTRERGAGRNGGWALRLAFAGKDNVNFQGVSQQTVLSPGNWVLRYWIKTSGVTTNQGVGVQLSGPKLDVKTNSTTGTQNWQEVKQTFTVQQPEVVQVSIVRQPSMRFDNKIAGMAWIDDVELSPVR